MTWDSLINSNDQQDRSSVKEMTFLAHFCSYLTVYPLDLKLKVVLDDNTFIEHILPRIPYLTCKKN
jgi:hypothetical protein